MAASHKIFWIGILYFAEGFPFGLLHNALPVYFRVNGVSLVDIGMMSLISLPWTLKVLWSPAVDAWGTTRHWFLGCQVLLAATLTTLPGLHPAEGGVGLWAPLLAIAVLSATQDIAIDAYSIRLLDPRELGMANGIRVTTYRVAIIASSGLFVAAAGWMGWHPMFYAAAGVMGGTALLSSRAPGPAAVPGRGGTVGPLRGRVEEFVLEPIRQFLRQPGFLLVAAFILLFKLGDMAMGPMIHPFWVDRHFTLVEIGMIPGTAGVAATILGALLGGYLTKRWGIFRSLWILGLFQAGSNLVYAAAAAPTTPHPLLMYSASVTESFTGGLGTAPFLAFLMRICDKSHAATQYALLSGLFGLTRSLAGAFSGWGVMTMGYAGYFTFTFFLAFPAYAMLPWVHTWLTMRDTAQGDPA